MFSYFKQSYSLHKADQLRRSIFLIILMAECSQKISLYTHTIQRFLFNLRKIMGQIQIAYVYVRTEDV